MSFLLEDDYPGAARPQTAAWRQPSPQQAGWVQQDAGWAERDAWLGCAG